MHRADHDPDPFRYGYVGDELYLEHRIRKVGVNTAQLGPRWRRARCSEPTHSRARSGPYQLDPPEELPPKLDPPEEVTPKLEPADEELELKLVPVDVLEEPNEVDDPTLEEVDE